MPAKAAVMKELEAHIDCIPDGSLGALLRDVRRLIVSQDKKLKKKNNN